SGADYSISNTGTITSYGGLTIDANRSVRSSSGNTTGSFRSTGTVRLATGHDLTVRARNDITLDGALQTGYGSTATNLDPYQQAATLGVITLSAGGYDAGVATPTFR